MNYQAPRQQRTKGVQVEHLQGEAERIDQSSMVMESYNPNDVSYNAAYQPQGGNNYRAPQQQQYAAPSNMDARSINEAQVQMQNANGPTRQGAQASLEQMTGVLNKINNAGISTTADGSDLKNYGLGVVLNNINLSIESLTNVQEWIPEGKEQLVPQLQKAGAPIANALRKYGELLDKIKHVQSQ